LHYAKAKDLERYLDMVVAQGEVFIQYWLAPGEAPVSDQVEVDGEMEIVPERLRGWL
jgi:inner membrane protein